MDDPNPKTVYAVVPWSSQAPGRFYPPLGLFSTREKADGYVARARAAGPDELDRHEREKARSLDVVELTLDALDDDAPRPVWWCKLDAHGRFINQGCVRRMAPPGLAHQLRRPPGPGGTATYVGTSAVSAEHARELAEERRRRDLAAAGPAAEPNTCPRCGGRGADALRTGEHRVVKCPDCGRGPGLGDEARERPPGPPPWPRLDWYDSTHGA